MWSALFYAAILFVGSVFSQEDGFDLGFDVPNPTKFSRHNITAKDGINLEAIVFDTHGKAKNPAILFISSWGLNKYEYMYPAKQYSDLGYTVVSYTARGFWGSSKRGDHFGHPQPGGDINMAGLMDQADIISVLDWMVKNTNADPKRIGACGISYGAGLSLIGSGLDSRIKAVVAMSGWVDIVESFLGYGNTIRTEGAGLLVAAAEATGSFGPDLQYLFSNYFKNTKLDELKTMLAQNDANYVLDGINKNKPAIFIANAYGDSLFTPNQFPAFFDKLVGPKHIEFAPGDHAGPEFSGLLPKLSNFSVHISDASLAWERSRNWFDYYVKQHQTGTMPGLTPIILNTIATGNKNNHNDIESYNSWSDSGSKTFAFTLDKREVLKRDWTPRADAREEVVSSFLTGNTTNVNGGVALITNTLRTIAPSKHFKLDNTDRTFASVFFSDRNDLYYVKQYIRGSPTLKLKIQPKTSSGIVVAYLLDAFEVGNEAQMITFCPMSFSNATPGKTITLTMQMTFTSWNIDAGHRLALVVGGKDHLFLDTNTPLTTVDIMDGSELSIPLRDR